MDAHKGGYVCGGVRYRTTSKSQRVLACARRWCEKRTGSAFGLTVYFKEEDIEFLQGTMRKYHTESDTGRGLESEFCEVCGTTVKFSLVLRAGWKAVAGGTFDQPTFWHDLETFVFVRSKPEWLAVLNKLEVHHAVPYHPSGTT